MSKYDWSLWLVCAECTEPHSQAPVSMSYIEKPKHPRPGDYLCKICGNHGFLQQLVKMNKSSMFNPSTWFKTTYQRRGDPYSPMSREDEEPNLNVLEFKRKDDE